MVIKRVILQNFLSHKNFKTICQLIHSLASHVCHEPQKPCRDQEIFFTTFLFVVSLNYKFKRPYNSSHQQKYPDPWASSGDDSMIWMPHPPPTLTIELWLTIAVYWTYSLYMETTRYWTYCLEYSYNKYSNLIGQLEVHYFTYGPRGLLSRSNIGVVAIF